jgi:hypothetical protein
MHSCKISEASRQGLDAGCSVAPAVFSQLVFPACAQKARMAELRTDGKPREFDISVLRLAWFACCAHAVSVGFLTGCRLPSDLAPTTRSCLHRA